ncbi:MAG: carboxypeptidase regulatory-like domain-containing protein [Planctomycetota bacterium]|nr:MAG: carboxypeptidase regulatory-like domain-containing protein [Planctomycetota bacterium]
MTTRRLALLLLLAAVAGLAYVAFAPRRDTPPAPVPVPNGASADGVESTAPGAAAAAEGGRTTLDQGDLAPAEGLGFVRGRVVGPDGRGLREARVRLVPAGGFLALGMPRSALVEGMTACRPDGGFSLPLTDPDQPFTVGAVAPGYAPRRAPVEDPSRPVTVRLVPEVQVSGSVVDEAGAPVAEAEIRLTGPPQLDGLPDPAVSGPDGSFVLAAPGAGTYGLKVRSAAGADVFLEGIEVAEGMEPLRVVVRGSGGVIVRVSERGGGPIEGAEVELRSTSVALARDGSKRTRTDSAGVARILSVDPGSWILRVAAPGYAEVRRRHQQRSAGPEEIRVELAQPGTLEATVVDRSGLPVPGFQVLLQARDLQQRLQEAAGPRTTDPSGVARWSGLEAGSYFVIGGGEGWQMDLETTLGGGEGDLGEKKGGLGSSVVEVEVLPGQVVRAELVLRGHARVRAEVHDDSGPVVGAEVRLHRRGVASEHAVARGVTGQDGSVLLPPVRPDVYQSSVLLAEGRIQVAGPEIRIEGASRTVRIDLPAGEVVGTLAASDGPVAGARVEITGAGAPRSWAVTAADGSFRLPYLPEGELLLQARVDGFLPWKSRPLASDGRSRVDLGVVRLDRAATIAGRALGLPPESQQGFAFRLVELHDTQGRRVAVSALENGDRFRFDEVRPGSYTLVVTAAGRMYPGIPIQVSEGRNEVEIRPE